MPEVNEVTRFHAAEYWDELEKAQIPGQIILRNAMMRSQLGVKQRPETFLGFDSSINPSPSSSRAYSASTLPSWLAHDFRKAFVPSFDVDFVTGNALLWTSAFGALLHSISARLTSH
ncbi:MAG TPA: hypothetical protein VLD65_09595 [Anaerolineales bacterium]|nr:hypothetical protein [Anaerolineales bacterium]